MDYDALDQLPNHSECIGPVGLVRNKEGGLKVSHLAPIAFRHIWVEFDWGWRHDGQVSFDDRALRFEFRWPLLNGPGRIALHQKVDSALDVGLRGGKTPAQV
ncbi:MAG: hypothetical protein ACJ8FP_01800 [Xanthobacteraceae bacterium]